LKAHHQLLQFVFLVSQKLSCFQGEATRDKTKQIINTISKWTDAFIVYISIYSSAHPSKYQALLKYMHTVRLDSGTSMENI
jgi:hypothetical protein